MKRLILLVLTATLLVSPSVFAAEAEDGYVLDESTMSKYDKNGIYYYNPNGGSRCISGAGVGSAGQITGEGYERVRQAVKIYGPAAMQAQRVFGVPWEVLIAQMQKESGTGTSNLALTANNWLGIRRGGDAGSYETKNNGTFAKFSSVEVSMNAWAGPIVLRNGMYDEAFQYLDPNNYDLHEYLKVVIPIYAPASDGNDPDGYIAEIESIIKDIITPAAEANGFASSAELAKQENITPGGQYPIGSEIPEDINIAGICASTGDINTTALLFSWPDRSHASTDPKPEYREALETTGISSLGDICSMAGRSCDAFVATVMRASGADPDFYCCGASGVLKYLIEQTAAGKYQEIENTGSSDNLQPGDIRSKSSHVEMYVVDEDGIGKIASASHGAHDGHCTGARTADHGINYYPDPAYRIFRKVSE